MLCRIAPEPIIALDVDAAGLRAAMRVIDLVLPMLEAGKSMRFCMMPPGQDPDDVIRDKGPEAISALLNDAQPLVQLLWKRETEGQVFDSPERKAALDKRLRDAIKVIPDPSLKHHYEQELKSLRFALFRGARPGPARKAWRDPRAPQGPTAAARLSALATQAANEDHLKEAVVLALIVVHPQLLAEFEDAIFALDCRAPDHARLQSALLKHAGCAPSDLYARLVEEIGAPALESLTAQSHISLVPAIRNPIDGDAARQCLSEELTKLMARRGHQQEIEEAVQEIAAQETDENLTWRLADSARARAEADHGTQEDTTEYEVAPSGARMNKDERSRLDAMISSITFSKAGGRGN